MEWVDKHVERSIEPSMTAYAIVSPRLSEGKNPEDITAKRRQRTKRDKLLPHDLILNDG